MSGPTIFLDVLGGLALFLFGVFQLASAIEPLASDRARELLARSAGPSRSGTPHPAFA